MWPITMCEVSLSNANHLERHVNSQMRKWLGLTRCLSCIGLWGNEALSLPSCSLVEEFQCTKVRLDMSLRESRDPVVRGVDPTLATGKKWSPAAVILHAKSALCHWDIVGLSLGTKTPTWRKATTTECRAMVIEEVRRQEEADRYSKAVA